MADAKPKTLYDCIMQGGIQGKRFRTPQGWDYVVESYRGKFDNNEIIINVTTKNGPDIQNLYVRLEDTLVEPGSTPQQPSTLRERVENSLLNKS